MGKSNRKKVVHYPRFMRGIVNKKTKYQESQAHMQEQTIATTQEAVNIAYNLAINVSLLYKIKERDKGLFSKEQLDKIIEWERIYYLTFAELFRAYELKEKEEKIKEWLTQYEKTAQEQIKTALENIKSIIDSLHSNTKTDGSNSANVSSEVLAKEEAS